MKPGPALDALIHCQVMGHVGSTWKDLPSYSIPPINAAWEVVEKMRESLWWIRLIDGHYFVVEFFNRSTDVIVEAESSDSFEHAICLSALRAKGVNYE